MRWLRLWLQELSLNRAEYVMFVRGRFNDQWNRAWHELVKARRGEQHLWAGVSIRSTDGDE